MTVPISGQARNASVSSLQYQRAFHVHEFDVCGARMLHVPKALKSVAVVSFKKLCAEARGASDYLAIARRLHTVIMVGIPVLGPNNRNEAARFVTLIDALYEYNVKFLHSADAAPDALYAEGDGRFKSALYRA